VAPPELWDGLPIEWAREPGDLSEVVKIWRAWRDGVSARRLPSRLQAYAHVPFCRTRCGFCQFSTVQAVDEARAERWLRGLEDESAALADVLDRPRAEAITVGGGTPSWLSAPHLVRVLRALDRLVRRRAEDYFSVELNPDSTTEEKLAVLAEAGVTRLSFGVQSLHPATLAAVARGYQTDEMVERTVRSALALDGPEVGLDLMASLPGETPESFEAGLRRVLAIGPDQVVVYQYQPVVRGRRTMPQGELGFRQAADCVRRHAPEFGYDVAAHTGASIVARRPGSGRFEHQYMQHPRDAMSTVALGAFAQSHAFGVGHYLGSETSGRYAIQGTTPDVELARHLGRRLGAGLAVHQDEIDGVFGAGTWESLSDTFGWLEDRGGLKRVEHGVAPRPGLRALPEAPWLLVDGLTVELIAQRAEPSLTPEWLVAQAPRIESMVERLAGLDARLVDTTLRLDAAAVPHPALTYMAPCEHSSGELLELLQGFAALLELPLTDRACSTFLGWVAQGTLSEPRFLVELDSSPRLAMQATVRAPAAAMVGGLLTATGVEPAREDLRKAAEHARKLSLVCASTAPELVGCVRPHPSGGIMTHVREYFRRRDALDLLDDVEVACELLLLGGHTRLLLVPTDVPRGDRLRRRLRKLCPKAPLWRHKVEGSLALAQFELRGPRPRLETLNLSYRARAPRYLVRADTNAS